MNPAVEMRSILAAALQGDPGIASLVVTGEDEGSLTWSVTPGPLPGKIAGSEYRPEVPFRREDIVELVGRTMRHRHAGDGTPRREDLDRLRDLHPACQSALECGPGWADLLHAVFEWVEEAGHGATWHSTQMKEKFGGLRLYYAGDPGALGHRIIDAAEHVSEHICEACGAPGRLSKRGWWVMTRCAGCADR